MYNFQNLNFKKMSRMSKLRVTFKIFIDFMINYY
jgi:hypothetical protein